MSETANTVATEHKTVSDYGADYARVIRTLSAEHAHLTQSANHHRSFMAKRLREASNDLRAIAKWMETGADEGTWTAPPECIDFGVGKERGAVDDLLGNVRAKLVGIGNDLVSQVWHYLETRHQHQDLFKLLNRVRA